MLVEWCGPCWTMAGVGQEREALPDLAGGDLGEGMPPDPRDLLGKSSKMGAESTRSTTGNL